MINFDKLHKTYSQLLKDRTTYAKHISIKHKVGRINSNRCLIQKSDLHKLLKLKSVDYAMVFQ